MLSMPRLMLLILLSPLRLAICLLLLEPLEVLFSKVFVSGGVQDGSFFYWFKRGRRILSICGLPNCHELLVSRRKPDIKAAQRRLLTRRPQDPKSCSEFAITSMPSQSIEWISSSSYSSVTVVRKNTRRPLGFNRYRASMTRSTARFESS